MPRPRKNRSAIRRNTNISLDPTVRDESALVAFYRETDRTGLIEQLLRAEIKKAKEELAVEGRTLADVKREFVAAQNAELIDLGDPNSVATHEIIERVITKPVTRPRPRSHASGV